MSLRTLAYSALILVSGLCAGAARAQSSFSAMLAVPMGDFSSDGSAMAGFGAGFEHNAPVGAGPAGWVTGVSFIFNASDKDDLNLPGGLDADGGNYLTLPVLTGLRLTGGDGGPVKFYLQGQAGVCLFITTELTISDGSNELTVGTDPNVHFGFGGGAGLIFNDKVHAGLRFFGTPEMDMSGTMSSGSQSRDVEGKLTVSMIQLQLGLVF